VRPAHRFFGMSERSAPRIHRAGPDREGRVKPRILASRRRRCSDRPDWRRGCRACPMNRRSGGLLREGSRGERSMRWSEKFRAGRWKARRARPQA